MTGASSWSASSASSRKRSWTCSSARLRVGVLAVDLVDDHDDAQADLERLAQHEAGLRHRALGGVDEQQAPVGHVQHPLDLAAEVGVAGRVDDVDGHVGVADRRVLGEDGDALLALEVVRVHDQRAHLLVVAEGVALLQQGVDQRGLAVVDVGDDRHVSDVMANVGHGTPNYTTLVRSPKRMGIRSRRHEMAQAWRPLFVAGLCAILASSFSRARRSRRRGMADHILRVGISIAPDSTLTVRRGHQGRFRTTAEARHLQDDPAPLSV